MEATAQFWDNIAERYAKKPVADIAAYQAKLRATKERLSPEDIVLDLGCGTGSLALELAPLVGHVHSVDISAAMIRIGRRKADAAGADNVTFHHTRLDALPSFESGSFGMVCAYNILHLIDDLDARLTQIMELLRPGGHFISTTPCLGESLLPYGAVISLMRMFGKAPVVHTVGVHDLQQSLARAGLVDIERRIVSNDKKNAFLLARKPS